MKVIDEVVSHARKLVVNQARYIFPNDMFPLDLVVDRMCEVADGMTEDETFQFLEGKAVVSDTILLALVEKIGVEPLYDEDAWIDNVADFLMEHKDDCTPLWNHLAEKTKEL